MQVCALCREFAWPCIRNEFYELVKAEKLVSLAIQLVLANRRAHWSLVTLAPLRPEFSRQYLDSSEKELEVLTASKERRPCCEGQLIVRSL